jgi:hypothetical protein
VPITAVFDGETAESISIAAAVHTMLDPAARIERLLLPHRNLDPIDDAARAIAAGNGVHHGVLSMVALHGGVLHNERVEAIAAANREARQSAGGWIDLRSPAADPVALASMIRACARFSVPFTVLTGWLPVTTQADSPSGGRRYGVMNLLTATLSIDSTESDTAAILADDDPLAYSIDFAGLNRHDRGIRARGSVGADRSPLMSFATLEAPDIVAALGAFGRTQ